MRKKTTANRIKKGGLRLAKCFLILYNWKKHPAQRKSVMNFWKMNQFISYQGFSNPNYPDENYHSFQFFKYHSFNSYTRYNYPKIFYGNIGDKSMLRITKYLKENGYITSYVSDFCFKDNIRTMHNLTEEESYDHQFLICDPNVPHFNLNTIRCLYGKSIYSRSFI